MADETVSLGAAFDPDRLCYGCRHTWDRHTYGDLGCDCCMAEHARRKHGAVTE